MVAGLVAIMCSNNMYSYCSSDEEDNHCENCINEDDCLFEDIYDDDAYLRCKNYKSYDGLED